MMLQYILIFLTRKTNFLMFYASIEIGLKLFDCQFGDFDFFLTNSTLSEVSSVFFSKRRIEQVRPEKFQ